MANIKNQPLSNVVWRKREELNPNNYNPNKVAPPEMELLITSILEDGWTQPIVLHETADNKLMIVDGFHRWTVSKDPRLMKMTGGKVPTVLLSGTSSEQLQMATIRHNRARGTHGVLPMAEIVQSLIDEQGLKPEEVMTRLGMEKEEVVRLLTRVGIPQSKHFDKKEFSKSWKPK